VGIIRPTAAKVMCLDLAGFFFYWFVGPGRFIFGDILVLKILQMGNLLVDYKMF
jgi:hypothetical protein